MSEVLHDWGSQSGATDSSKSVQVTAVIARPGEAANSSSERSSGHAGSSSGLHLLRVQLANVLQYTVDLLFAVCVGIAVNFVVQGGSVHLAFSRQYFWASLVTGVFLVLIDCARHSGHGSMISTRVSRFKEALANWTLAFGGLLFVVFALGANLYLSRVYAASYYVVGIATFGFWRAVVPPIVARWNAKLAPIRSEWLVIGDRRSAALREIAVELTTGGNVTPTVLAFDAQCEDAEWVRVQQRVIADASKVLRGARNGAIYLCEAGLRPQRLQAVCASLSVIPVGIFIIPDSATAGLVRCKPVIAGNHLALEFKRAPMTRRQLGLKRVIDLALGLIALVLFSPVFAIIALAVSIDSKGPIFFRQSRTGLGGKPFRIYKFRSMYVMEDGPRVQQARRNDPRVTRVGRFLRSSSLDELPQLFNVLKGEMSLVGPRPHAIAHDEHYSRLVANYEVRQHVKPGITGWAQVNGLRGETPNIDLMRERIELDVWYAQSASLLLDVEILARTVIEVFRTRNAY